MTFSFGIMVHQHTTISMLRNFISTVNALGIPPPQYEIIVAGDWQQKPEDFSLLRTLGPFVHVCGDCEFTDKIRTIFEVANHEFVWVSHDYILPLPTFYDAMRSFGRGAPWMVPGILLDFNGREIDEFVLRGRLWTSHHYTKFTSNNTGTEPISIPSESRSELLCGAHHHHADYLHHHQDHIQYHHQQDHHKIHEAHETEWSAMSDVAVLRSIINQGKC
jgi:hypothetical protein